MDKIETLFFVCMSKNCFSKLKKNLEFLVNLKNESKFNIKILVIDSDSVDGTKKHCRDLLDKQLIDSFVEVDNLENLYNSRIERLTICRNKGLKEIDRFKIDQFLYIPLDSDILLFEDININKFELLIKNVIEDRNVEAIFPFSLPYYYDIFALRKPGWVNNNIFKANLLKSKFRFLSFFINYYYIFRNQFPPSKFKENLIKVNSAFGGMGVYKIKNISNFKYFYSPDFTNLDMVSEHISFNKNFENLFIKKDWNIPAPKGYIFFNTYTFFGKFIYFLKSIKNNSVTIEK